jgi:7-cyano-7-deazaguanine reductase
LNGCDVPERRFVLDCALSRADLSASYNSSAILLSFVLSLARRVALRHSFMPSRPSQTVETFANPAPERDYLVHIEIPEFTCLCPLTGQPDFATLVLDYVPDKRNVELKSLKLYTWSFRNQGAFHEAVTNRIVDELVRTLRPRYLRLTAKWYVRGGLFTTVVADHRKKGWKPQPHIELGQPAVEGAPTRG